MAWCRGKGGVKRIGDKSGGVERVTGCKWGEGCRAALRSTAGRLATVW